MGKEAKVDLSKIRCPGNLRNLLDQLVKAFWNLSRRKEKCWWVGVVTVHKKPKYSPKEETFVRWSWAAQSLLTAGVFLEKRIEDLLKLIVRPVGDKFRNNFIGRTIFRDMISIVNFRN